MSKRIEQLVEAVKTHAAAHYETGGWDYVVEAWDDADIAECIGAARTAEGAIRKVGEVVGLRAEVRADVVAAGDDYDYSADRDVTFCSECGEPAVEIDGEVRHADAAVGASCSDARGDVVPRIVPTLGTVEYDPAVTAAALRGERVSRLRVRRPSVDTARVAAVVREAASEIADFTTGSSVGEVSDFAMDLLSEDLVALDLSDLSEWEIAVQREVFGAAGLSSASSDASDLDLATLDRIARGGAV